MIASPVIEGRAQKIFPPDLGGFNISLPNKRYSQEKGSIKPHSRLNYGSYEEQQLNYGSYGEQQDPILAVWEVLIVKKNISSQALYMAFY